MASLYLPMDIICIKWETYSCTGVRTTFMEKMLAAPSFSIFSMRSSTAFGRTPASRLVVNALAVAWAASLAMSRFLFCLQQDWIAWAAAWSSSLAGDEDGAVKVAIMVMHDLMSSPLAPFRGTWFSKFFLSYSSRRGHVPTNLNQEGAMMVMNQSSTCCLSAHSAILFCLVKVPRAGATAASSLSTLCELPTGWAASRCHFKVTRVPDGLMVQAKLPTHMKLTAWWLYHYKHLSKSVHLVCTAILCEQATSSSSKQPASRSILTTFHVIWRSTTSMVKKTWDSMEKELKPMRVVSKKGLTRGRRVCFYIISTAVEGSARWLNCGQQPTSRCWWLLHDVHV